ncbi:helix-turn-helix transcriptional regulator [Spartinivicinus poritis]|uniref:LuxR C-terminal-related transcriptional regulator n=1 Tax=Spartinivicinus poritis TaxID=2994640 RepID=A0ABT5UGV1_9GAMM|nr:LuxR C-terminal-related transcriptional regulator [Spartinivicinus sp. A2-2]MDE1465226.1 LuxR C-terminal-related transcriptional regulator [Spartinivicinus sp. A2-2]
MAHQTINSQKIKNTLSATTFDDQANYNDLGLTGSVEAFISELYRAALHTAPKHFYHSSLTKLTEITESDAAIWCYGHIATMSFHTYTTVGVPVSFANRLISNWAVNPILTSLIRHAEQPIDIKDFISDEVFFQSACYRDCFRPFKLKRALSSIAFNFKSGFFDLLTIYRKRQEHTYNNHQKQLQTRLSYHLRQAAKLHKECIVASNQQARKYNNCSLALCDSKGFIYYHQPNFLTLLGNEFKQQSSHQLPEIMNVTDEQQLQLSEITAYIQPLLPWKIVAIRKNGALDKLSCRQQQIVQLLTQGFSYKQIAIKLNVAPSTVANHLYQSYKKLNITSRSQLQNILATISQD